MLERLAGYDYYCFLDGYSRYNQIPIAPEDQEKIAFTCYLGLSLINAFRSMQCRCNIPALYVKPILLHGQNCFRDFYG